METYNIKTKILKQNGGMDCGSNDWVNREKCGWCRWDRKPPLV